MCWNCWAQSGFSAIDNPVVREAARAIGVVYEFSCNGGNLHVIVDDWNYGDCHIGSEHDWTFRDDATPEQIEAERYCLGMIRGMTEPERASALALYDEFWGQPDSKPPVHDDDTLDAAIAYLDVILDDPGLNEDDWRLEGLGNAIREYETRTDILNRGTEDRTKGA